MIRIRPAGTEDLVVLRALETACFGRDAWGEEALEGELAGVPETRCVLTAEDPEAVGDPCDVIVGYASLLAVDATADVQRIAVRPDRRREGIGQLLLDALLETARERGCAEALLEVRDDNAAAIAMYEAVGFEEIARRRGYYHGRVDARVLRLAPV